jgi:hypothetical protein
MNKDHPNKGKSYQVNWSRESLRFRARRAEAVKRKAEREMLETTSLKDLIK